MALKKDISVTNNFGIASVISGAYIKIESVDTKKQWATALVSVLNAEKTKVIFQKLFDFLPTVEDGSENHIHQAYVKLKLCPEYADAIDC